LPTPRHARPLSVAVPHQANHNLGDAKAISLTRAVHKEGLKMISRIWHGWTAPTNADTYESLLKTEIFQGIQARQIAGYRGIHLLRRDLENEVEFVTIMWFDSIEAVRTFAGEDYEAAVVPPKARAVLSRFDARSQHYEVKVELED
jgi:hypothetical protein